MSDEEHGNVTSNDESPLFTKADFALNALTERFEEPLKNVNVDLDCLKFEFKNLMDYAKKHYNIKGIIE